MIDERAARHLRALLAHCADHLVRFEQDESLERAWAEVNQISARGDRQPLVDAVDTYIGRLDALARLLSVTETRRANLPLIALTIFELMEAGALLSAALGRAAILAAAGRPAPVAAVKPAAA